MGDREQIIARLRGIAGPAAAPRPDSVLHAAAGAEDSAGERRPHFVAMLEAAGGQALDIGDGAAAIVALSELAQRIGAERWRSIARGLEADRTGGSPVADLDFWVADGEFGVAENGAVWVPCQTAEHRAALFLAQHVALVLTAGHLVRDMHEAYARANIAAQAFGVFIAGPSKTADIEQSLVIGAHGPRSLTVIFRQ